MLYVDQPVGVGFSWALFIYLFRLNLCRCRYGSEDVNSTWAAAPPVWKVLQMLFESQLFAKYLSREYVHSYEKWHPILTCFRLILATESYGGHYGPEFVVYFDEQNTKINKGIIQGEKILISALMINKWVNYSSEPQSLLIKYQWLDRSPLAEPGICRLCDERTWLWTTAERHNSQTGQQGILWREWVQGATGGLLCRRE